MKESRRSLISVALLFLLALNSCVSVCACAPVYNRAVFVSWIHPDFPLSSFAAGNLGVIQQTWARSYQCVAYRYLTGQPLDQVEQASIKRLWRERLSEEGEQCPGTDLGNDFGPTAQDQYLALRKRILKCGKRDSWRDYSKLCAFSNEHGIMKGSFMEAVRVLKDRIKIYGINSQEVHEWLKGQDCIYGLNASGKMVMPELLPAGFDRIAIQDRLYQRAAAAFYQQDYPAAEKMFRQIAADRSWDRRQMALYMVARCKTNAYLNGKSVDEADAIVASIEKQVLASDSFEQKERLLDLVGTLRQFTSAGNSLQKVVDAVERRGTGKFARETFGRDVGALTDLNCGGAGLLGLGGIAKDADSAYAQSDLALWIAAVHDSFDPLSTPESELLETKKNYPDQAQWVDEELHKRSLHQQILASRAEFAMARWRRGKQLQWLVAAMLCGGLRGAGSADALAAARAISPQSPAYQTASFYVIDALIACGKLDQARERLGALIACQGKGMSPSTANLFKSQQMAASGSLDQYLQAACMRLSASSNNCLYLPDKWYQYEKADRPPPALAAWEDKVADDLDYNLPLSAWVKLARRQDLPSNLHGRIVMAAWLRAVLLGKKDAAVLLSEELVRAYRPLAPGMDRYNKAAPGVEKQYALARLVLDNYGMTPYVGGGLPRFDMAINQFNYYQENYWLPLTEKGSNRGDGFYHWGGVSEKGDSRLADIMAGYYQPGVRRFLSAAEQNEARKERASIEKMHPSVLLGQAVLAEAKINHNDPEMAHLLYKIVKLPLWSGSSKIGTVYSKSALRVLKTSTRKVSGLPECNMPISSMVLPVVLY